MTDKRLGKLYGVLQERKSADPQNSYVASLYHKGTNKILQKIGEEASEVIIAGKDAEQSGDNQPLIYEMADLWFHSLVLLASRDIAPQLILDELERRSGLSGLAEKAARNLQQTEK